MRTEASPVLDALLTTLDLLVRLGVAAVLVAFLVGVVVLLTGEDT